MHDDESDETVSDVAAADESGADEAGADEAEVVRLQRWDGVWGPDDPFAGLRADVAAYGHLDPLTTLRGLADATGIPVGALARYVLARWATGGTDALLELGTSGVDHLARVIAEAEDDGRDAARLEAYGSLREIVSWLRAGLEADGEAGLDAGGEVSD